MNVTQSMQFAINFSHSAAQLFQTGRLALDRFKTPNWPDMVAEAGQYTPVAVHFSLKAGRPSPQASDWDAIQAFLDQTGTPYVNIHLEVETKDLPDLPQETDHSNHRTRVLEQMLNGVQAVVDHFGAKRVIAENTPYRPGSRVLRPSADPHIIREVIETTGCGLLLDIPHARISAHYLGMNEQAYLTQLPTDRLREMHFTGVVRSNGWLQDHQPAQPDDWQARDWVLGRIRCGDWAQPWMLAFEYGGVGGKFAENSDPQVIETQGNQLYQKINIIS